METRNMPGSRYGQDQFKCVHLYSFGNGNADRLFNSERDRFDRRYMTDDETDESDSNDNNQWPLDDMDDSTWGWNDDPQDADEGSQDADGGSQDADEGLLDQDEGARNQDEDLRDEGSQGLNDSAQDAEEDLWDSNARTLDQNDHSLTQDLDLDVAHDNISTGNTGDQTPLFLQGSNLDSSVSQMVADTASITSRSGMFFLNIACTSTNIITVTPRIHNIRTSADGTSRMKSCALSSNYTGFINVNTLHRQCFHRPFLCTQPCVSAGKSQTCP